MWSVCFLLLQKSVLWCRLNSWWQSHKKVSFGFLFLWKFIFICHSDIPRKNPTKFRVSKFFFSVIKARKCNLFNFEYVPTIHDMFWHPSRKILLKVNNRNTRTRCEICLKLSITTSERCHWRLSGVFIVNFEHISHLVLVFLKLTLSWWMPPAMSQSDSSGFLSTVLESFRHTWTFLTTTNQKTSFLNLSQSQN